MRWLAAMFLKITLPTIRNYREPIPGIEEFFGHNPFAHNKNNHIEQPHTVYTFLRLCRYLIETRGVPKHWIAAFLDSLMLNGGKLNTSARDAKIAPLKFEDAIDPYKRSFSEKAPAAQSYDLRPVMSDLRTTLSTFYHADLLPCSLTTANLIPAYSSLKTYTIEAEIYPPDLAPYHQLLALVFFNQRYVHCPINMSKHRDGNLYTPNWLREQMTGGRLKNKTEDICGNFVFCTTFRWEFVRTHVGGLMGMPERHGRLAWTMESVEFERMKREGWTIGLVQTDKYTFCGGEYLFSDAKVVG